MHFNEQEIQKRMEMVMEHLKDYYSRVSRFSQLGNYDLWVQDNPQVESQFLKDAQKSPAKADESREQYFFLQFAHAVLMQLQKAGDEATIDQYKLIDTYKSMLFEFCVLHEYSPAFIPTRLSPVERV